MPQVPYWHICQRLNNGLARHLTGEQIGLPLMARMLRTPVNLLGCTLERFVSHIESQMHDGMTWGNFRRWHLDHIYPVSAVDVCDDTEVFAACNYRNLQPMWKAANIRKHATVTDEIAAHFRSLCDAVRQPWHMYHVPHESDVPPPSPPGLTSDQILAMPEGAFGEWVQAQQAMARIPPYGHFTPPA